MQNSDNSPISLTYSITSDIWPALIALAIVICLGSYSWRRRKISAAKPFAIACLLGGFWIIGVILELVAVNFSTKVFWVKFQAIWQLPVAIAITFFVLQYAGLSRWLNFRNSMLLSIVPLLSVLVMVTNEFHHLMWIGFRMNGHIITSPGRLYWVFNGYIYLLGIVNFVVLVRLAIRSPGHRLPVAIILSGQVFARVGYTIDRLNMIGPGESVLLVFGVVSLAYAFAFFRFHAIDPVAAAHRAVLEQMGEGLLVLDMEGRIADVNPVAATMLGTPKNSLKFKRLEDIMPVDLDDLGQAENKGAGNIDITLWKDNSARQYNLNLTSLRGTHGEVIGRLILLHDVTEQRQAQARFLEQQRIVATLQERERLAREIHDGIGQTLGYISIQTQTALKWVHDKNIEKAESLMIRLEEVVKDAHADIRESIFGLKTASGQEWSFILALKEYIGRFREIYGIRTELFIPDGIDNETIDPNSGVHLFRVVQEALTNARKHSGADALTVHLNRDGSKLQIIITDDGHGFDVSRIERRDGGHFGLVFMRERMEQIGGSLRIESIPGGGTTLTIDVSIA